MTWTDQRQAGDRIADTIGSAALAGGCGGSLAILAPGLGWPTFPATLVALMIGGLVGWIVMRAVPSDAGRMTLPAFAPVAIELHAVAEGPNLRGAASRGNAQRQAFAPLAADSTIPPDATDALHAALDDIRRLMRRA